MTVDLRLLGIISPEGRDLRALIEVCRQAEAGGVTAVQLRGKMTDGGDLLRATEALVGALTVPVFVNDRADVAIAGGAAGVHLGAEDIPAVAVRPFAPRPFTIGVSVGDPDEAADVADADVDYWSVGPIYLTSTKLDAGLPIGARGFGRLVALAPTSMPVLAIGGINASNAVEIFEAGAHGIAVSSAIFEHPADTERVARTLRAVVDRVCSP